MQIKMKQGNYLLCMHCLFLLSVSVAAENNVWFKAPYTLSNGVHRATITEEVGFSNAVFVSALSGQGAAYELHLKGPSSDWSGIFYHAMHLSPRQVRLEQFSGKVWGHFFRHSGSSYLLGSRENWIYFLRLGMDQKIKFQVSPHVVWRIAELAHEDGRPLAGILEEAGSIMNCDASLILEEGALVGVELAGVPLLLKYRVGQKAGIHEPHRKILHGLPPEFGEIHVTNMLLAAKTSEFPDPPFMAYHPDDGGLTEPDALNQNQTREGPRFASMVMAGFAIMALVLLLIYILRKRWTS